MTSRVHTVRRTLAVAGAFVTAVALVSPAAVASVRSGAGLAGPDIKPAGCNIQAQHPGSAQTKRVMSCFAYVNRRAGEANVHVGPNSAPAGYGPSQLQNAYKIGTAAANRGGGQTIAIVDAYDDPNAESDLATYRSQFGLPACTTANGCFQKLNQNGTAGNYPPADAGWAVEISLDLDMVSAACPNCNIVLVEGNSAGFGPLGTAENTAAGLADAVSNSFGAVEQAALTQRQYTQPYTHTGVFILASSGDSGYGEDDYAPQFPSVLPKVTAVGGTALHHAKTTTRKWKESAWGHLFDSGAGSGCSTLWAKPAWQTDSGCAKRMVADVSAVADPNTGVAVYDSYQSSGWQVVGGTSAASPLVAGVVGLAQNGATINHAYPYNHVGHLYDAKGGDSDVLNLDCWSGGTPKYFCHGVAGYDGPTGLGSPHGYQAF